MRQDSIPASYMEQSLGNVEGTDPLGLVEVFHEATKYFPANVIDWGAPIVSFLTNPRLIDRAARGYHDHPELPGMKLADGRKLDVDLGTVLQRRVSARKFGPESVDAETLGSILHHALRCNRTVNVTTNGAQASFQYRPYPSGGGLFPVEHYVIPLRVDGIAPSVAHYSTRTHELRFILQNMTREAFFATLPAQQGITDAAVAIVSTGVFQRSIAKYGARGYRFALIEAGCASQNLALVAAAHGLASMHWGGYFDNQVNELCNLDSVNESILSMFFIGHAAKEGADHGKSGAPA